MPVKRKRSKRTDRYDIENLMPSDFLDLLVASPSGRKGDVFETEDDLRQGWETNKCRMMELVPFGENVPFYACHPGTRPAPWYKFEAKEPRRVTGKQMWVDFRGELHEEDAIETQEDYLRRLGLLSAEEEEMLRIRPTTNRQTTRLNRTEQS
jgi:hypothetical protein